MMALTCTPPLWAKALRPTKGRLCTGTTLAVSFTKRDSDLSFLRFSAGMQSRFIFRLRTGIMAVRSALPQRSPKPLIVPCTMTAPARTAAMELARASPQSLWVWMPSRTPGQARAHLGEYGLDVAGQAAAVGVAQHDEVGTALGGGRDGLKRVVAVVPEAVEEVLRVVDHFAAVLPQAGHRVPDHGQVFLQPVFHHLGDVQVPALAEDGHDPGPAVDERLQLLVRVGRDTGPAGAAERRQPGVFESRRFRQLEETQVLGVRAGPSAFNVVDADVVQAQGDLELFLGAEGDVLALGAVPECRVVNEDRFHRCLHRGGKPRTVIFGFRA